MGAEKQYNLNSHISRRNPYIIEWVQHLNKTWNNIIINTTAKANDTTDILQTFR